MASRMSGASSVSRVIRRDALVKDLGPTPFPTGTASAAKRRSGQPLAARLPDRRPVRRFRWILDFPLDLVVDYKAEDAS
jgi:hypothetical protein